MTQGYRKILKEEEKHQKDYPRRPPLCGAKDHWGSDTVTRKSGVASKREKGLRQRP